MEKHRIILSSYELRNKLKTVGKIVGKAFIPAHDYFLFEVNENKLTVTGADSKGNITTNVDTDEISGDGFKFLMESKLLQDVLKELPEQPLELTIDVKNFSTDLKHQGGTLHFTGLDPKDFSIIENKAEIIHQVHFESQSFRNGINAVHSFASTDDLRPIMQSVFIESRENENKVSFVSTNTNIMGLFEHKVDSPEAIEKSFEFILPIKISKILADISAGVDVIEFEVASKYVCAKFDETTVIYRLLEGRYPNYRAVIPGSNDKLVKVQTKEFSSALRRASLFSGKTQLVVMTADQNQLSMKVQDNDFQNSANETVTCEYSSSERIEIGFKGSLLENCINCIDTSYMQLSLKDSKIAALLDPLPEEEDTTDKLLILIMPMQINI